MLGTLHAVQAAATLIWDMSFTGTSSSPNADNIAVTDCNGASYSGITPSFGGGSVTDGIYNSSDSRLTFRDNASLLSLNNSFSFVVKASLNGEGTTNWSVLFGLGEFSNWNLKDNYTKGDNDGWGFAPEGYSLSKMTSTPGTVVQSWNKPSSSPWTPVPITALPRRTSPP